MKSYLVKEGASSQFKLMEGRTEGEERITREGNRAEG